MINKIPKAKTSSNINEKDKKVFLDLETEIIKQAKKALDGNRLIESYFLLWSSIEQFMLPKLVNHISRHFNIKLPKDIAELPISQVIRIYYCISHDHELFNELEVARKKRNFLVHKIYKQKSWNDIKKSYKKSLKTEIVKLLELLQDRFIGKTKIPSMELYSNGWNDFRKTIIEKIRERNLS